MYTYIYIERERDRYICMYVYIYIYIVYYTIILHIITWYNTIVYVWLVAFAEPVRPPSFRHSCHILPFQPILWSKDFPPEPANAAKHSPKSISEGGRIWRVCPTQSKPPAAGPGEEREAGQEGRGGGGWQQAHGGSSGGFGAGFGRVWDTSTVRKPFYNKGIFFIIIAYHARFRV